MKYVMAIFGVALVLALTSELGALGMIVVVAATLGFDTKIKPADHIDKDAARRRRYML